MPDPSPSTPTV